MSIKREHGTLNSYLTGYILSLIFTLIPYYLVVNQVVVGNSLLITILGFAVVQVIIQITFFLHLGRGPKPRWNLFFFTSTVGIILMVVFGSVFIMSNLHYNMSPADKTKKIINDENIYQLYGVETGACYGQHDNHKIMLMDGQATPAYTVADKCDTLTFMNHNKQVREITFAAYPEEGVYAGLVEVVVEPGRSETITLSESGEFEFYDILQPEVTGQFLVNPQQ